MDFKKITDEGLRKKYSIFISSEKIEKEKQNKLEKIAKEVKIQGFRPGKAPLKIIESQYASKVLPEVLDTLANNSILELYKSEKLEPIGNPKVSTKEFSIDKGLELEVELEIFPEIKDLDLSKIVINKEVIKIQDEDTKLALDRIASYNKEYKDIDDDSKELAIGDVAVIDFLGKINNEAFSGGEGKDFPLELGSKTFISDFEDQLVGLKKGDKKDVKVKFPENYQAANLANKDAVFEVEIKKIQAAKPAEITDDLAKKVNFNTLQELKEDIKNKYGKHVEALVRGNQKKELLEKLKEVKNFDLPQMLLEEEKKALWENYLKFKEHMKSHEEKGDFDTHKHTEEEIELYKKDEEEVKKDHETKAKERLRLAILLNFIAKENKIVATSEAMQEIIEQEAAVYGQDPKMLLDFYNNNKESLRSLQNRAYEQSIINFILSKVSFKEKEVSFEEFAKVNNIV